MAEDQMEEGREPGPLREAAKKRLEGLQQRYENLLVELKERQFAWRAASGFEEPLRRTQGNKPRSCQPWTSKEQDALVQGALSFGIHRPEKLKPHVVAASKPAYKHEEGDIQDALLAFLAAMQPHADPKEVQWLESKASELSRNSKAGGNLLRCGQFFLNDSQPKACIKRLRFLDQMEHILSERSIQAGDRETEGALFPIKDSSLPWWWSSSADIALLSGVHKHGCDNLEKIKEDRELASHFKTMDVTAIFGQEGTEGEPREADGKSSVSCEWPSSEVLWRRVRRVVEALAKVVHKKEAAMAKLEEKKRKEEERNQVWSKKDRHDMVRALMLHGVPRKVMGGTEPNWVALREAAGLYKKWETTVESFYHELIDEMNSLVRKGGATAAHPNGCQCAACRAKRNAANNKEQQQTIEVTGEGNDDAGENEAGGEEDMGEDMEPDDMEMPARKRAKKGNQKGDENVVEYEDEDVAPDESKEVKGQEPQGTGKGANRTLTPKTASWLKERLEAMDTLHWVYRSFKGNWQRRMGLQVSKREELPSWWQPNKHDKELVHATLKYGYANWQVMHQDSSLAFLHGEEPDGDEDLEECLNHREPPPSHKALTKRLRSVISFFRRYASKHGKRKRELTDLPSASVRTASKDPAEEVREACEKAMAASAGVPLATNYPRGGTSSGDGAAGEGVPPSAPAAGETKRSTKSQQEGKEKGLGGGLARPGREGSSKASRVLTGVTLDEHGTPELPLRLSNKMTLESLGRIDPSRTAFHTERRVFPIGYCFAREHTNMENPNENTTYHLCIDERNDAPLFRVHCDANPGEVIEHTSATGAWGEVMRRIAENRGMSRAKTTASGIEMFGLSHPVVEELLRRQPNFNKLTKLKLPAYHQTTSQPEEGGGSEGQSSMPQEHPDESAQPGEEPPDQEPAHSSHGPEASEPHRPPLHSSGGGSMLLEPQFAQSTSQAAQSPTFSQQQQHMKWLQAAAQNPALLQHVAAAQGAFMPQALHQAQMSAQQFQWLALMQQQQQQQLQAQTALQGWEGERSGLLGSQHDHSGSSQGQRDDDLPHCFQPGGGKS